MTNKEAEAYALYEGIRQATLKGIRQIIICGDSMILIRAIVKQNIAGSNIYRGHKNLDPPLPIRQLPYGPCQARVKHRRRSVSQGRNNHKKRRNEGKRESEIPSHPWTVH